VPQFVRQARWGHERHAEGADRDPSPLRCPPFKTYRIAAGFPAPGQERPLPKQVREPARVGSREPVERDVEDALDPQRVAAHGPENVGG
jgi:hypothetical protein